MLATDDTRLCRTYLACKNYAKSYAAGSDTCAGCAGDISPHRAVTKLVDEYVDPVISVARHSMPEDVAKQLSEQAWGLRLALQAAGHEVDPAEVGMLVAYRLLQRVAALEAAVRMRA